MSSYNHLFPGGISAATALSNFRMPSPFLYHVMFDDFNSLAPADWTLDGAGSLELAEANANGGVVWLTTAAAAGSEQSMAFGAPNLNFSLDIGKDFFMSARLKIDDVSNAGFLFGLTNEAPAPLGTPPVDGVYFRKLTGAAPVQVVIRSGNSDVFLSPLPVHMDPDVYVELTLVYTAQDNVLRAFADDASVSFSVVMSAIPEAGMGVAFSVTNATAESRRLSIDNYMVALPR